MNRSVLIITFSFLFIHMIGSLKAGESAEIYIEQWLRLGPVDQCFPALHTQKNINGKTIDIGNLLTFSNLDVINWQPQKNQSFGQLKWEVVSANGMNELKLNSDSDIPSIQYLASYIRTGRWLKSQLKVSGAHPFQVFLDGALLESKSGSENTTMETDNESGSVIKEVKLERGTHLLLVKTVRDPQNPSSWTIKACIQPKDSALADQIAITLSPRQIMNMETLLDSPEIKDIDLSSDGSVAAISMSRIQKPTDKTEKWLEFRKTKSGKIIREIRGDLEINDFSWAPEGMLYAYTSTGLDGKNLWIGNFETGNVRLLLENIKNLGSYQWAPDNSFIIYSVSEDYESGNKDLDLITTMEDRWPWWRNRSYLYRVNVRTGLKERLTAGLYSTDLNDISPDGKELIFRTTQPDPTERPYSKNIYFRLNLKTLNIDTLFESGWGDAAQYSPDGQKVLLIAGPSFFGKIGVNVSNDKIPNEYDNQAYIYDLKSKGIQAITKDFKPSIINAVWHKKDDDIYFSVTEKSYQNLYRYNPENGKYEKVDLDVEVLDDIAVSANSGTALYMGTSANIPPKLFALNLSNNKSNLILDPAAPEYKNIQFGKVERWTFMNKDKIEIEGRIYYPPDFDSSKKYPCIVYYYGGTVPVERSFGGRYPKNVWAANGYVVYVMQPSGATGFGQDFSALHVNDWGKITADEIIMGVNKFLDAHDFIDRKHVGSIGASYGGFMTMLLQTKTDIFACAIAHAGISSISSYWGEGYWGYLYSAVATANSFPWNREDIYVDQSPLFSADKITTPLLLLHGKVDTNVPIGESIQLFTALKLLGREVELIEIAGQDHHIMEYNKRKEWSKTIIAGFDKYLKEQPQWWKDMY
ncbi:MAG: S9 family peptidase [Calditrichaceae bacterium]